MTTRIKKGEKDMAILKRIETESEKYINNIINKLYSNCDGSENDNWKLKFISDLNNVEIRLRQYEINPNYILVDYDID
jgi:hypothetical protein